MLADYYEITVEGHLDRAHWQRWFGMMQVTPEDGGITRLAGPVVDQAALHGLLGKIRDLGLTLISVQRKDRRFEGEWWMKQAVIVNLVLIGVANPGATLLPTGAASGNSPAAMG